MPLKTLIRELTLLLFLVGLFSGCDAPAKGADPLGIGDQELRFEMLQRQTTTVPGVMGRISVKIGDVETSAGAENVAVIDHKDESSVATAELMGKNSVLDFKIDRVGYVLQLAEFDGTHVFSDSATFTLRRQ